MNNATMSTHIFVPKVLLEGQLPALMDKFTIKRKYEGDPVPVFAENEDYFGFPLYASLKNMPVSLSGFKTEDSRTDGKCVKFDFESSLRGSQVGVISKFDGQVRSGITGFTLSAPPGFGKTVCLIKMLSILGRTSLVVVPKSDLVEQWRQRFIEHSSLTAEDIGVAAGGECDFRGKKVVIGLIHTLALDRFGEEFRRYFGVIVFDEVDRSLPPSTFSPVISLFPARYRIGASATLSRQDGLDLVFKYHLGSNVLSGEDSFRMKPTIVIRKFPGSSGNPPRSNLSKLEKRGVMISMLSNNLERNRLICEYIVKLISSGRRCLVLSDRTRQLSVLEFLLVNEFSVDSSTIGFYARSIQPVSGKPKTLKKKDLEKTAGTSKVVLATYGLTKMGTDIPDLSGLVYATPQTDVEQAQGRIERSLVGKKSPIVVDIVDTQYTLTTGWALARERFYRKKRLKIKEVGGLHE